MRKLHLLLPFLIFLFFSNISNAQSFYLGKSVDFIKQEKGSPTTTDFRDGETILVYKIVSQKGTVSMTMYYFDKASKCHSIIQDFDMWFIIPWTDELSQKYKRLDKYNWQEKTNIIHAVEVINEVKFIYVIKYKS